MSYKIAIGSSDGVNVDLKFGEVERFLIFEADGDDTKLIEERFVPEEKNNATEVSASPCGSNSGCSGHGNGCSGSEEVISKVTLIEDCRSVVCKRIGFQAQKQFEKKAISVFDVECSVEEALRKISYYYRKIDNHETLRRVE